jgi:hypothetical protein
VPVVPRIPTITTGILTSSTLSALAAVNTFFENPPFFVVGITSATTACTTATFTPIHFDNTVKDSAGGHSNSTNNTRYTAQYAGWYGFIGAIQFPTNATGVRAAIFYLNGVAYSIGPVVNAASGITTNVGHVYDIPMNVGDFVELDAYQTSGGTLTLGASSATLSGKWKGNL